MFTCFAKEMVMWLQAGSKAKFSKEDGNIPLLFYGLG